MVAVQEHRSADVREELGDSNRCRMEKRNAGFGRRNEWRDSTRCRVQKRNPGTGNQRHSMESTVIGGQFMAPLANHRHPYSCLSPLLPNPAFLFCILHWVEIPPLAASPESRIPLLHSALGRNPASTSQ